MEVSGLRVRFKGILVTFAYDTLDNPLNVAILAYGLPEYPLSYKDPFVVNLIKHGFLVAIPQYLGTFDSFGACTIENTLETILQAIKLVRKGTAIDLITMNKVTWKARNIVLVGGSFGANVVLAAGAKSRGVVKIAAVAPFGDFVSQGKLNYPEEKIMHRYRVTKRVYPLTWRFSSAKPWVNLSNGKTAMDHSSYLESLKGKDILLIHGQRDEVVNVERTRLFFNQLKNRGNCKTTLIIIKKAGHMGLRALREKNIFQKFIKWAKLR